MRYKLGSEFSLAEWNDWEVAQTEGGSLTAYLGYLPLGYSSSNSILRVRELSLTIELQKEKHRLLSIKRGALCLSSFLHETSKYRLLPETRIMMPTTRSRTFGVYVGDGIDVDATRAIFGSTHDDLSNVLSAIGKMDGDVRCPRVTSSRSSNRCELTGYFIPPNFPYLAFAESQYIYGHVSLPGFYRFLRFGCVGLTESRRSNENSLRSQLLENGAEESTLDIICNFENSTRDSLPYSIYC